MNGCCLKGDGNRGLATCRGEDIDSAGVCVPNGVMCTPRIGMGCDHVLGDDAALMAGVRWEGIDCCRVRIKSGRIRIKSGGRGSSRAAMMRSLNNFSFVARGEDRSVLWCGNPISYFGEPILGLQPNQPGASFCSARG